MNSIGKWGGQYRRYKYCKWVVIDTVFNLILKIKAVVVLIIISTCLSGMMKSTPVMTDKVQRPSKYTVKLFDCRVPRKIQLLQIPETCDKGSKGGEMATLRETYVLSPRKMKKTSGVSCFTSVSEFGGYCGAYSLCKFQQTPIIKKSILVTPEICNKTWREGIVTLPDLTSQSVRVGDSILYDYVPPGIIRVDSHLTSCQGTQVRLGSQMVEESLVLLQYCFEIAEEEFIIKED